ncbi:hypothetical protein F4781DRAFT_388321 [Annulohypoxylon bovei var. microspora]|nr:hypothetical protein F4781DRAFT_388321 [Annulohypoxylon bovei var. microspora]
MSLSPIKSQGQRIWKLGILSSAKGKMATTENLADVDMIQEIELTHGRGNLITSLTTRHSINNVLDDPVEYRNLTGRYRTKARGFWVVFFDGMRWYPATRDEVMQVKFGPGTGHYVPRFINSQGDVLGSYMTAAELSRGPLFSFIPRNRPIWDSYLTSSSIYDMLPISSPSPVYIKDDKEGLMAIPNGRMIMWCEGSSGSPPMHHWNMLRQRSGRINSPEPLECHPNTNWARKAEVPWTIREIALEIGGSI